MWRERLGVMRTHGFEKKLLAEMAGLRGLLLGIDNGGLDHEALISC